LKFAVINSTANEFHTAPWSL